MKIRHVYLGLCVPGFFLPYLQLIPWLAAHGLDLRQREFDQLSA